MDCILQWGEYFGSSLAKDVILGVGLALLTGAAGGSAEGSAGEPEGHILCVPERMSSGLVLWTEGLQHLTFIKCICVCRCITLVWFGFFHNESILWLLHLLRSAKQSPVGSARWIPVKKHFCCELKPPCQHVFYWLGLEFPTSADSKTWAELCKWDEENHHAPHLQSCNKN